MYNRKVIFKISLFTDSNLRSCKLKDCLALFGREQEWPHDAESDVENLQFLCKKLANEFGYRNYQDYLYHNKDELFYFN